MNFRLVHNLIYTCFTNILAKLQRGYRSFNFDSKVDVLAQFYELIKGAAMQIEKALINNRLHVSKVS